MRDKKAEERWLSQQRSGLRICSVLRRLIYDHGFSREFDTVSFPDGDSYQVKLFQIDPQGVPLFRGSKYRGIPMLHVEIEMPDVLSMKKIGHAKNSCHSVEELEEKVKKAAETILADFFVLTILEG